MVTPNTTEISAISQLQFAFKMQLDERIATAERLWALILKKEQVLENSDQLYRQIHNLVGSGGTFGAVAVSNIARDIELLLKSTVTQVENGEVIDQLNTNNISELLISLKNAARLWEPSDIPFIQPKPMEESRESNLIYLAEDDELLAAEITNNLESRDYRVMHFSVLSEFESACHSELPAVILMDIVFSEGDVAGIDSISRLQANGIKLPPVIFISVNNNIESRLFAARAGACRYFCKPIDIKKLLLTLDGLTSRTNKVKYRVLIIDDDETLLAFYKSILTSENFQVMALSSPMKGLDAINQFKPDVIVLDVYMPECTGPELAQVIRQDDNWSLVPIMFLSTETDLNRQFEAISLGGDDFLVKPVEPDQLVSAILSRAKRARWANKINSELISVLRENEFQIVSTNQHNIVSEADTSGKISRVNRKFSEISGYTKAELEGENHRILKSGIHPSGFFVEMWEKISHGQIWRGVICNRKKNGDLYWVSSTIVPFLNESGKPYKYVSIRTDITEHHLITERFKKSQEFANIGSWDWDITTGDLKWSEQVWPLFGYTQEILNTTYKNFIAAIHPDDRELVSTSLEKCIESGDVYDLEFRVIWMDGCVHWLHGSGNIVRNEKNEPVNMLGILRDIDEKKRTEKLLTDSKTDAENANRTKSTFLSQMSHEFRTPMNAIMGYGQLLKLDENEQLGDSQIESIDEILKASEHMLSLIDDVLSLAKIESGNETYALEDVDICETIVDALKLVFHMAQQRGIIVSIYIQNTKVEFDKINQQPMYVVADRLKLKQVILNLLSNGIKYNAENGTLTITCEELSTNVVKVGVTDQGEGISIEQQFKLFNSFDRLGAEFTKVEGTGIGLVITKSIVEGMGGKIGVTSEVGKGASFWVELKNSRY